MKEERLYIVGYMASGKTTFGRALAEAAGWDFIDLDLEVERREGRSPARIITEEGEAAFRMAESMALKATAPRRRVVVACGGGTPCWRDNMEFMTLHGMTLWLVAPPERLAARILEAGRESRPLAAGKSPDEIQAFVEGHLRSRQPHYCRAMMRLDSSRLETPEEIAEAVERFLAMCTAIRRKE